MNAFIKIIVVVSVLWIDLVTMGEIFNIPRHIDPELQTYVDDFIVEANKRHVQVDQYRIGSMEYSPILDEDPVTKIKEVGVTYFPWRFGHIIHLPLSGRIEILSGLTPPIFKRAVIYHELGHALLGLNHDKDPNQIMNEIVPDAYVLEHNWPALLDHLFATKPTL